MPRVRELVRRVAELVGPVVRIIDGTDRWPAILEILTSTGAVIAAAHLGTIGLTKRGRDAEERRFQNPGKGRPVVQPFGTLPLVLGLWEQGENPVLVAMGDPYHRIGVMTRQSLFMPLWQLHQASNAGWSEHTNSTGERIVAFHPALLPTFVEMILADVRISAEEMTSVVKASGLLEDEIQPSEERARRTSAVLVRQRQFGKRVVDAYQGLCAMCDLDLGLVEGAHIYPVSAPESPDEVWNGLALCRNHHSAFDQHLVWVEPASRRVELHPSIHEQAKSSKASSHFIHLTQPQLRAPSSPQPVPRGDMFERRYSFFGDRYAWSAAFGG